VRNEIENFWKQTHKENGYDLVYTPHVANLELWKTSGHYDFYKEVSERSDEHRRLHPLLNLPTQFFRSAGNVRSDGC